MNNTVKNNPQEDIEHSHANTDHLEYYGDSRIASADASIPKWLIVTYLILPIWGFYAFYAYWNGSQGWLDRGYWQQLQIAANTTFPFNNAEDANP